MRVLAGLSSLERLGLLNTSVHDIEALANLTKLSAVDQSGTKIENLTVLNRLGVSIQGVDRHIPPRL